MLSDALAIDNITNYKRVTFLNFFNLKKKKKANLQKTVKDKQMLLTFIPRPQVIYPNIHQYNSV